MTFEEAKQIVEKEPIVIKDGVRLVQVVTPLTEKYLKEFSNDLLVNKFRLKSEDSKNYAKDNKFTVTGYNQQIMNDIFRPL